MDVITFPHLRMQKVLNESLEEYLAKIPKTMILYAGIY